MNEKIWVWIGVAAIVYITYRIISAPQRQFSREFKREVNEILTKKEHKVKGRYE